MRVRGHETAGPGVVSIHVGLAPWGPEREFDDRAAHRDRLSIVKSQGQQGETFLHIPILKGRHRAYF